MNTPASQATKSRTVQIFPAVPCNRIVAVCLASLISLAGAGPRVAGAQTQAPDYDKNGYRIMRDSYGETTNAAKASALTLESLLSTNELRTLESLSPSKEGKPVVHQSSLTTNGHASGATNSMNALDDKHHLAIGDRISFRIIEDEEDPKPLSVTDSGDLEVPYIGRFPAAGRSCKELAHSLKTELEKEYYYQATVIVAVDVMARSRGKVYLSNAIRAPGSQEVPSDEVLTVSKAILRAGGFSEYADPRKVLVTRKSNRPDGKDQTFTVDVEEVLKKGKTESDLAVEPGDLIYVPERGIRLY